MMLKSVIFTLLITCCVAAVQQGNPIERSGRIVGGRDATIEEFPFMAAMLWFTGFACGGAIINTNTILSAAHCTAGYPASQFTIRAGSNRVGTGGQVIQVARIIEHEQYSDITFVNDICILKLSRHLVLSASVRAIQLPPQGFNVGHASIAAVHGWGATNTAGNRPPTVLQTLNTLVIGNTQCGARIGPVPANQLCAGGVVGRDACYGDSGGPLTFQGRVVGVVSHGPGIDCAVGYPIVYMRVSEYLPFIVRNM